MARPINVIVGEYAIALINEIRPGLESGDEVLPLVGKAQFGRRDMFQPLTLTVLFALHRQLRGAIIWRAGAHGRLHFGFSQWLQPVR